MKKSHRSRPRKLSQAEAAWALGLTPQAIGMLAKQDGAPVTVDGGKTYLLWPEFPRWRDAKRASKKDQDGTGDRLDRARARIEELKLEELEGSTVRKEEYRAELRAVASLLRAIILAIPGKWAHRIIGIDKLSRAQTLLREMASGLIDESRVAGDEPKGNKGAAA